MGLIEWGIDWVIGGIDNAITGTERNIEKLGSRFGFTGISWKEVAAKYPAKNGLLWRIPDADVPTASTLFKVQKIFVDETERAIVLKDGMSFENIILEPGMYDIQRTIQMIGKIQVIWTSREQVKLPWGAGNSTGEGDRIGGSGYYWVEIVDPLKFLRTIAIHDQVYTKDKLDERIRSIISSKISTYMAGTTAMDFRTLGDEDFFSNTQESVQQAIDDFGLQFIRLTLDNRSIPQEALDRVKQTTNVRADNVRIRAETEGVLEIANRDRQMQLLQAQQELALLQLQAQQQLAIRQLNAQAGVEIAQLEAQAKYYEAQGEATEHYVTGAAEVEKMRRQISIGMDPLKLKMAEAMEELAKHPSEGTLYDGRPQIIANLQGLVNAPSSVNPNAGQGQSQGITAPANQGGTPQNANPSANPLDQMQFPAFVPPATLPIVGTPTPSSPSTPTGSVTKTDSMDRQKIEDMLDKLDERFANGEITEQTYLMMRDKWQKRLDAM